MESALLPGCGEFHDQDYLIIRFSSKVDGACLLLPCVGEWQNAVPCHSEQFFPQFSNGSLLLDARQIDNNEPATQIS